MKPVKEVIEAYFKDGKTLYFHPADIIADDHYLRYEWSGERIIISIGSNEGETTIKTFSYTQGIDLEYFIKAIIY